MRKHRYSIIYLVFLALYFLVTFYICTTRVFISLVHLYVIINVLITFPLVYIILYLSKNYRLSYFIITSISTTFYIIDNIVYNVRYKHIILYDFKHLNDALNVSNRYNYNFSVKIVLYIITFLIFNTIIYFIYKNKEFKDKKFMFIIAFIGILYLTPIKQLDFLKPNPYSIGDYYDTNFSFELSGVYYNLYYQVLNSSIDVTNTEIEDGRVILSNYDATEGSNDIRYVVIMNEALTDYSLIGDTKFEDPFKNIHSRNDIYEGKVWSSVYGGNTCDSEFEFLTGCSLHFLPDMYSPYTLMNLKNINSLAKDFNNSYAIHPFFEQEFNRAFVYKSLGFNDFISGEDFYKDSTGTEFELNLSEKANLTSDKFVNFFGDNIEYIRGLVSDSECYNKINTYLDNTDSNFIFTVTIQNHGGYNNELDSYNYTDDKKINEYLTLISISDKSFCDFIDSLRGRNEKIVVLMFGDHQPALDVINYIKNYDENDKYCSTYFLWSNFDLDENYIPEQTSLNYLSAYLKKATGNSLSAFDNFRLDIAKYCPVITRNFYVDIDNNIIQRNDDKVYDSYLTKYSNVQKSLY